MSSDATARDVNLELRRAVFQKRLDAVRRWLDDGGSVTATFTILSLPFLEDNQLYRFSYPMGELGDPMTVLTLWRKSGRRPWGQDGRYKPQSATRIAILRLLLERGADASDGTDVRLAGARELDRAKVRCTTPAWPVTSRPRASFSIMAPTPTAATTPSAATDQSWPRLLAITSTCSGC